MVGEDVYKEITRKIAEVYEAEKGRPSLYPLEETFFSDVKNLLNYLWDRYVTSQENTKESSRAPLYLEEYRNFKSILTQIYLRREKKIIRLAISAAMGGGTNTENMVTSERRLFEELAGSLKRHREETLGGYITGMAPSPSIDTTTEEYIKEVNVTPPGAHSEKVSISQKEERGLEETSGEETPVVKKTGPPDASTRGEKDGGRGIEGIGSKGQEEALEGAAGASGPPEDEEETVKAGWSSKVGPPPTTHAPGTSKPRRRGELFGTRNVLFVEKEPGDIATGRERSLYLREGDILYTDQEIMDALAKNGFGKIVEVKE